MRKLNYTSDGYEVDMGIYPVSIVSVGGLGYENDVYTVKALNQDGESYVDSNLRMRNITLELRITADYELNKQRIIKAFNPKKEGVLTHELDSVKRKAYCRVESVTFGTNSRDNKVLVSLLCPNPFFYGYEEEIKSLAKWEECFHFPVVYGDASNPVIFGKRVTNKVVNLYNSGDVSTGVIIEMRANARITNPSINKVSTGEEFKLLTTLENNDIIIIDSFRKRAEKNGENIYNLRARGSRFFDLDVGDNVITYSCDSGEESLDITIVYENSYLTV